MEIGNSAGVVRIVNQVRQSLYSHTFAAVMLLNIQAPITLSNLKSLAAWQKREGGTARHNPLNTTQHKKGATPYNTFADNLHVWNYTSVFQGAAATAETLMNGSYPDILERLRLGFGLCGFRSEEFSSWSGGGYHDIIC